MAGFCVRHGIEKSAHLHKLCQSHTGYFNLWEECRGPKQNPNDCKKQSIESVEPAKEEPQLPSKMQMAGNFIKSAAKHVANGMAHVTSEIQEQRLKICNECPFIVENNSRCAQCGCFLEVKTKWASSSCPIGKW
jgi:hypothetical protein